MNATRKLLVFALLAASLPCAASRVLAQAVDVWLDAGHGGGDTGTPGYDHVRVEKNIALQVSAHTYSALTNLGYSVYLTRLSDYYVTLGDRARMASGDLANINGDRAICQLFISLHMDGREDPTKRGSTTYAPKFKLYAKKKNAMLSSFFDANIVHDKFIQNAAIAFLGCHRNIGVRFANYQVLRESTVPSILIESCILTNQCQQNKIAIDGNQATIGQGIAAGVSFAITPGSLAQPKPATFADPGGGPQAPAAPEAAAAPARTSRIQSLSEGFEDAAFPPPGWTTTTLGGAPAYRWQRTTDTLYVHSGIAGALVGGESPSAVDEWLISPPTTLGGSDKAVRFFWSANRTYATGVNAECRVKPVSGSTWTRVWQLLDEPAGNEWEWKERSTSLLPWAGQTIQVAFRASGTNGGDVNLDDVAIGDFATTAPPLNDHCATATPLPGGTFSTSGTTYYASNDMDPAAPDPLACSFEPLSSGDVFYSFHAGVGDSISVTVSAAWNAVAYIVDSCDSAAANCLAAAGQYDPISEDGVSFTHVFSASSQYSLVIDGRAGEGGPFQLTTYLHGPTVGVDPQLNGTHDRIRLLASPNPSQHGLRIEGILPAWATGSGQLAVFDATGRLVFDETVHESAGRVSISWNGMDRQGRRVGPGIYRARLRLGREEASVNVVLLE
jgi:N-acetylmuramoyl-L-alanine amidase